MASENRFTREGLEKLRAELEQLKGEERLRIAETIRDAKSHGDLRENAAYHEAKLNQTRLEKRIADLEGAISKARIVDDAEIASGGAQLGMTVTLKDVEYGDQFDIKLVGAFEGDPDQDLISVGSPLGLAVVGRNEGDAVEVQAPGGVQKYVIVKVG